MCEKLFDQFEKYVMNADFLLGYICPGHGVKGKQFSLTTDGDLKTMYTEYHERKSVTLWLKSQVKERKRSRSESLDDAPSAKHSGRYETQMKKVDEIQEILEKLKENHDSDKYTPEQLHCWANLIQMKKHSSYDSPPQYRYFGKKSAGGTSSGTPPPVSPGKRIHHSECIDQLTKLHMQVDGEWGFVQ